MIEKHRIINIIANTKYIIEIIIFINNFITPIF